MDISFCFCVNKEIGEKYGVTESRSQQILEVALRQLRHPSRTKHFLDFLPEN